MSHCKNYVASCALDDMVKIFDVSNLGERPKDGTFDMEAYERGIENKLASKQGKKIRFEEAKAEAKEAI